MTGIIFPNIRQLLFLWLGLFLFWAACQNLELLKRLLPCTIHMDSVTNYFNNFRTPVKDQNEEHFIQQRYHKIRAVDHGSFFTKNTVTLKLTHNVFFSNMRKRFHYWDHMLQLSLFQSSQWVWAKKNTRKKRPFLRKKPHNFSKKRALFDIISFLKRVFCLPLLHKISPFNVFKTINYLFLFFNISKTSYFTKQQTPLMIIISHNFKEMIFFIRID